MKAQAKTEGLNTTAHTLLNETVEWSGKFLAAYAHLQAAERTDDEAVDDEAWGDLMTALFLLKDKAEQAHQLLDEE